MSRKCNQCCEIRFEKEFFDERFLKCRSCYAKIPPHTIRCPRCNEKYDGYWQECDRCIQEVYPEK